MLPPVEAVLVADELPATKAQPAKAGPTDDERLAAWCRAEVDRVYPDDERHGQAVFMGVRSWRSAGVERHAIAAFVSDACGVSFRSIRTDVPRFVTDRIKRYRPADGLPPIPAEWKPEVKGPEIHRPDPEWVALNRARMAKLAARPRAEPAGSLVERFRRRFPTVPPAVEVAS